MRTSVLHLARAAAAAAATPSATATRSAAGKQAVEELEVYLRAMNTAQRRWAREIVAHESHVRRLMMVEEQCRERLKQQVLKGTRAHLKYLTNTDLMAVAQLVTPPSVDVFLAYGIPLEQVNGFTVYVMGRLAADPNRLDVPLPILLADFSSTWAIVPPRKKEAYTELAAIFRPHLPARDAEPPVSLDSGPSRRAATPKRGRQGQQHKHRSPSAAGKRTAPRAVASARKQVSTARRRAAARVKASEVEETFTGRAPTPESPPPAQAPRCGKRGTATPAAAPHQAAAAAAVTAAAGGGVAEREAGPSARPRRPAGALAPLGLADRAAVAAMAARLSLTGAERAAFGRFAVASLREMTAALAGDAQLLPTTGSGNGSGTGRAAVRRKSTARGAPPPHMAAWLPIAAQEWAGKTRRQKAFYLRTTDKTAASHG